MVSEHASTLGKTGNMTLAEEPKLSDVRKLINWGKRSGVRQNYFSQTAGQR